MNPDTRRTLVLAAASFALLSGSALAQGIGGGDPFVTEATSIVRIALTLVKLFAVIFIIAGMALLASGRWAVAGLAGMAFGVIGMAKADQIANWLTGA